MNSECIICILKVCSEGNDAYASKCGHIFHYACITTWIGEKNTCPCCRKSLTLNELVKLNCAVSKNTESSADILKRNKDLLLCLSNLKTNINNKNSEYAKLQNELQDVTVKLKKITKKNKKMEGKKKDLTRHLEDVVFLRDHIYKRDKYLKQKNELIFKLNQEVKNLRQNKDSGIVNEQQGQRRMYDDDEDNNNIEDVERGGLTPLYDGDDNNDFYDTIEVNTENEDSEVNHGETMNDVDNSRDPCEHCQQCH